jgi:hypothetical protein
MKRIYITFTDEEHQQLMNAKKKQSWHDFIMTLKGGREW